MCLLFYHFHQETEGLKVASFGRKFELMPLEKRDDDFKKIASVVDLVSVAILMIRTRILLEVDATALKEFFQSVEYILIFFDKFDIELWLRDCSSHSFLFFINIPDVDSEASFPVYQAHDVIWCKTIHFE